MFTVLKYLFGKTAKQVSSFQQVAAPYEGHTLNPISKLLVGAENHLQCPRCGASHLQRAFLKTYERLEGDAFGSEAVLKKGKVMVSKKYTEKRRSLRVGTDTVLKCEGCGQHSVFSLSHEKGINWPSLRPCELA